jgi:hypothetical protein
MEEIWKDIPGFEGYQASNLGRIKSFKGGKEKFIGSVQIKKNGYKRCSVRLKGININVGRCVLMTFNRMPNEGEQCDHIDRNGLNNRIENLRWVTHQENQLNKKTWGNSNLKGVSYSTTSYERKNGSNGTCTKIKSQITINGKRIWMGNYLTEQEAHEAYKQAFLKYRGYEWVG